MFGLKTIDTADFNAQDTVPKKLDYLQKLLASSYDGERSVAALKIVSAALSDPDAGVRVAGLNVANKVGKFHPDMATDYIAVMDRGMKDKDAGVRAEAIETLRHTVQGRIAQTPQDKAEFNTAALGLLENAATAGTNLGRFDGRSFREKNNSLLALKTIQNESPELSDKVITQVHSAMYREEDKTLIEKSRTILPAVDIMDSVTKRLQGAEMYHPAAFAQFDDQFLRDPKLQGKALATLTYAMGDDLEMMEGSRAKAAAKLNTLASSAPGKVVEVVETVTNTGYGLKDPDASARTNAAVTLTSAYYYAKNQPETVEKIAALVKTAQGSDNKYTTQLIDTMRKDGNWKETAASPLHNALAQAQQSLKAATTVSGGETITGQAKPWVEREDGKSTAPAQAAGNKEASR